MEYCYSSARSGEHGIVVVLSSVFAPEKSLKRDSNLTLATFSFSGSWTGFFLQWSIGGYFSQPMLRIMVLRNSVGKNSKITDLEA